MVIRKTCCTACIPSGVHNQSFLGCTSRTVLALLTQRFMFTFSAATTLLVIAACLEAAEPPPPPPAEWQPAPHFSSLIIIPVGATATTALTSDTVLDLRSTLEIRLVNGTSPVEGILQIRPNATAPWGTVCSNSFKEDSSFGPAVVCSMLGFGSNPIKSSSFVSYGPITRMSGINNNSNTAADDNYVPIWLDELNCSTAMAKPINAAAGETRHLADCTIRDPFTKVQTPITPDTFNKFADIYNNNNIYHQNRRGCLHGDDVGVRCVNPNLGQWEYKLGLDPSISPSPSGAKTRGLVLVRPHPMLPWGTVRSGAYRGQALSRRLMCKAMGFPNVKGIASPGYGGTLMQIIPLALPLPSLAGASETPFPTNISEYVGHNYIYDIACPTTATDVSECTLGVPLASQNFTFQIGLFCDDEDLGIAGASVVLVDGSTDSNGQIQYNQNGIVYYIPSRLLLALPDGSPTTNVSVEGHHNTPALRYFCALAGFPDATEPRFRFVGILPDVRKTPTMARFRNITCTGDESVDILQRCVLLRMGADDPVFTDYPAGVDCFPERTSNTSTKWEVRLVGGSRPSIGLAQIRIGDGQWGTIAAEEVNNFPLWEAFCAAAGYGDGNYSVRIVRRLESVLGGSLNYYNAALGNQFAPVYLSNVSCNPAPRYTVSSSSLESNANVNPLYSNISFRDNCTFSTIMSSVASSSKALALDCNAYPLVNWETAPRRFFRDPANYRISLDTPVGSSNGFRFTTDTVYPNPPGVICTRDINALTALCRMAGFATAVPNVTFVAGQRTYDWYMGYNELIPIFLYDLKCPVNASSLEGCTYAHFQAEECDIGIAGAKCVDMPNTSGWEYRLNNNGTFGGLRGRVEVRPTPTSEWGTVTSSGWQNGYYNSTTATTIYYAPSTLCSKLGFGPSPRAIVAGVGAESYGQGGPSTPIWYGQINCPYGATKTLEDCGILQYMSKTLSHGNDLGIDCDPPVFDSSNVVNWEYRGVPVGPEDRSYFRIEARENSTMPWGTLQATKGVNYATDQYLAEVSCRQIGQYDPNKMRQLLPETTYNADPSVPVIAADISCYASQSNRSSLFSACSFSGEMYRNPWRTHQRDIVVDCDGRPPVATDDWEYRLINGTDSTNGLFQMRLNNSSNWGRVCFLNADSPYNFLLLAVCRSIGVDHNARALQYATMGLIVPPPRISSTPTYPQLFGVMPINSFYCFGNDAFNLGACVYDASNYYCQYQYTPYVECAREPYSLLNAEFRLNVTDPLSPASGIAMMRPNSSAPWGTMTGIGVKTDVNIIRAICGSLGYTAARPFAQLSQKAAEFNANKIPIYVDSWQCPSNAKTLVDCTLTNGAFTALTDGHDKDIAVSCLGDPQIVLSELKVRLSYGTVRRGVVEVKTSSTTEWGPICGDPNNCADGGMPICASLGLMNITAYNDFTREKRLGVNGRYANYFWPRSYIFPASTYDQEFQLAEKLRSGPAASLYEYCGDGEYMNSPNNFYYGAYPAGRFSPTCNSGSSASLIGVHCHANPLYKYGFAFRGVPVDPTIPNRLRIEMKPCDGCDWGSVYDSMTNPNMVEIDPLTGRTVTFSRLDNIAAVACRTLGYRVDPSRRRYSVITTVPAAYGPVWAADYRCPWNTTHLYNCTFIESRFGYYLTHAKDLTVECDIPSATLSPTNWIFRLSATTFNARNQTVDISERKAPRVGFGRLEMIPDADSAWGSVTAGPITTNDGGFTNELAVMACRSAGFITPNPSNAVFGRMPTFSRAAGGPIWASFADCATKLRSGNISQTASTALSACDLSVFTATQSARYSHSDDIWIDCYPNIATRFASGNSAGSSNINPLVGRIEVTAMAWLSEDPANTLAAGSSTAANAWGPLCNDYFDKNSAAQLIVCRSLGFENATRAEYYYDDEGGEPKDGAPYVLDDLWCTSSSIHSSPVTGSNLFSDCSYRRVGTSDCSRFEKAGVRCIVPTNTVSASIIPSPSSTKPLTETMIPPAPIGAAVKAAETVTSVMGAIVSVSSVASVTGGQLGVANAMIRLASCDDDSEDESEDESLPMLVHPFQFAFFGNPGGDGAYAAAAISNTIFIPLIVAFVARWPMRMVIEVGKRVTPADALTVLGWPSVVMLPFATLAEGIGVSIVRCFRSTEPTALAMGVIATVATASFTGAWVWVLVKILPYRSIRLARAGGRNKSHGLFERLITPMRTWVPVIGRQDANISVAQNEDEEPPLPPPNMLIDPVLLEHYGNVLSDKRFYFAEIASFMCSLVVGIVEGLPPSKCRGRVTIATMAAIVQCICSVLTLVPLELFLQVLLSACIIPLSALITFKVFDGETSDPQLEDAMAILSMGGNIVGIGLLLLSVATAIWGMFTIRRASRATRRESRRRAISKRRNVDIDFLNEADDVDMALLSGPTASNSNGEHDDPLLLALRFGQKEKENAEKSETVANGLTIQTLPANAEFNEPILPGEEFELSLEMPEMVVVSTPSSRPAPTEPSAHFQPAPVIRLGRSGYHPPEPPQWQVALLIDIDREVEARLGQRNTTR